MKKKEVPTIYLRMTDDQVDEMVSIIKSIDILQPPNNIAYFRTIRNMASANGIFFDYKKKYQIDFDWLTNCIRIKENT